MLSILGKNSADNIFLIFFPENRFLTFHANNFHEMSKLICQSLFSGKKNQKNIISLSTAEIAQTVIKIEIQSIII